MKAEDAGILTDKDSVRKRCVQYFKRFLNTEEDKEAEIVAVARELGIMC